MAEQILPPVELLEYNYILRWVFHTQLTTHLQRLGMLTRLAFGQPQLCLIRVPPIVKQNRISLISPTKTSYIIGVSLTNITSILSEMFMHH